MKNNKDSLQHGRSSNDQQIMSLEDKAIAMAIASKLKAAVVSEDLDAINTLVATGVKIDAITIENLNCLSGNKSPNLVILSLIARGVKFPEKSDSYESTISIGVREHIKYMDDFIKKIAINNNINFNPEDSKAMVNMWQDFSVYSEFEIKDPEMYIEAIAIRTFDRVRRDNFKVNLSINYNIVKNFGKLHGCMTKSINENIKSQSGFEAELSEPIINNPVQQLASLNILSIISYKTLILNYAQKYCEYIAQYFKEDKNKFDMNFFLNAGICKDIDNQPSDCLFKQLPDEIIAHIASFFTVKDLGNILPPLNVKLTSSNIDVNFAGEQVSNIEE